MSGSMLQQPLNGLRPSCRRAPVRHSRSRLQALRCSAAAQPAQPGEAAGPSTSEPSSSGSAAWWTSINRIQGVRGPDPTPASEPSLGPSRDLVGDRMQKRVGDINKAERQRVWDAMRVAAAHRYVAGEMPSWFDPAWLQAEEAPINAINRFEMEQQQREQQEWEQRQQENQSSSSPHDEGHTDSGYGGGDDGRGSGDGRWSGGGGGWWREDDPYWPLHQWGDHPMRWWTFAFAGVMAAGGLLTTLSTGYLEPVQLGCGAAALLAMAAAAMSDAASVPGVLGVKLAWAVCALVAAKEVSWGWQHKRRRSLAASSPRLELCGVAALAMCCGLMLTDMSALGEVALPTNPGAVFKSPDVAYRSSVWQKWGYGQVQMRV